MKPSRLVVCLAGWLWMGAEWAQAQDFWMPYVIGWHYSATEVISSRGRPPAESLIYVDGDKIRMESLPPQAHVLTLIRPDQQAVYWVIPTRKQMLVLPYDAERIQREVPPQTSDNPELLGVQTIFGITCMKYRLTNDSGKTFRLWIDAESRMPLKIIAEDGDYMLVWKKYQDGPQDPKLFDPPDDFNNVYIPLPPKLPAPLTFPPKGLGN